MTGWQTTPQNERDRILKQYGGGSQAPAVPGLPPAPSAMGYRQVDSGRGFPDDGSPYWFSRPLGMDGSSPTPDASAPEFRGVDSSMASGNIPGLPPAGAAGDTGDAGQTGEGSQGVAENSQQRWSNKAANSTQRYYERMAGQSGRGANRVASLMARRIAPGPGNIPGYGTPSARNGSPAPVSFNNSPSSWSPY